MVALCQKPFFGGDHTYGQAFNDWKVEIEGILLLVFGKVLPEHPPRERHLQWIRDFARLGHCDTPPRSMAL